MENPESDGKKTFSSRNNQRNEGVNEKKRNRSGSRYMGRKSKDKHGKRGKDKPSEDNLQSKDVKENLKSKHGENLTGFTEPIQNQGNGKQPSHGKTPKTQPTNEKASEAVKQQQLPVIPSQSQKSDNSTISHVPLKNSTPESNHQSSLDSEIKVPDEIQKEEQKETEANHINEVKIPALNHEQNHAPEKTKSSSQSKIPSKEAQWSLDKQEGKRQYDRNFLLEMQKNPLSLKRPDSLPNLEVVLDGPVIRPIEGKSKMMTDFTPGYLQSSSRRMPASFMQQKGGKNSQQGPKRGGPLPPRVIDINLNFSTESKLKSSENAWKPSLKKPEPLVDEELSKHDDTIKRMRGILNKLTPDNFLRLVEQVKQFKIEKLETFEKVIGLIFEKAVDEQGFSTTYAQLCKVLSQMSVKAQGKGDETRFRNLIISKCQSEFEKDNSKDLKREEREKEIESQKDRDKKTEMKATLDFEEMRLRKRSVGNIRFIGELYKLKMLTSSIMMRIIMGLLDKKDDESLECLCKLLTTIGKMLEISAQTSQRAQDDLNEIFTSMKALVDSRKTSSRVRFLMMDVVDLRLNNWVPRREDAKPKTKAEVHEDIRKEEIEQQILLSTAPRKDDRERKRSRDNRMMSDDGGWSTVTTNTRRGPFDSSRLRNNTFNRTSTNTVEHLELRTGFSSWGKGSSGGVKDKDDDQKASNRFSVLETPFSMDRRSNQMPPRLIPGGNVHRQGTGTFGSKSMPPPSEKDTTSTKSISIPPGDRSKSNSRSNSRQASKERVPPIPVLDDDVAEKYTKSIADEYASNNDLKDATLCVQERFKGKSLVKFVSFSMEWVIDKSSDKRKKIGILYHHLLREKIIILSHFLEGSRGIIENISDFEIDIPQLCEYMGEVLCRLLDDGGVVLRDILKILQPAGPKMSTTFGKVLKQSSKVFGERKVTELWKSSKLALSDILPGDSDLTEYTNRHGIEFLLNESATNRTRPIIDEEAPFELKYVRKEMMTFFKNQATDEAVFKWIDVNVGRFTNTKKFVRALTTALLESLLTAPGDGSVILTENFEAKLREKVKFIHKYVDNNQLLELPCIYGMQTVCVEYQHPPGFLEQTFNVFYDLDVLSEDSFIEWENSNDPEEQLGKGVCITSVKKFLHWIKTEETDQSDSIHP